MVRRLLDAARDSLGRIEMEVREHGERPALMEASRAYAQFCLHARDFLGSLVQHRPFPRRLADRIAPLRDVLVTHRAAVDALELRPTPEELSELVLVAQQVPATG